MSAEVWAVLEGLLDGGWESAMQADELAVGVCGEPVGGRFYPLFRKGWKWRLEFLERALKAEAWPLFLGRTFTNEELRAVDSIRRRSSKTARLIKPAEAAILFPITPRIADAAKLATKGRRPEPGDLLRAYLPSSHPLRALES